MGAETPVFGGLCKFWVICRHMFHHPVCDIKHINPVRAPLVHEAILGLTVEIYGRREVCYACGFLIKPVKRVKVFISYAFPEPDIVSEQLAFHQHSPRRVEDEALIESLSHGCDIIHDQRRFWGDSLGPEIPAPFKTAHADLGVCRFKGVDKPLQCLGVEAIISVDNPRYFRAKG